MITFQIRNSGTREECLVRIEDNKESIVPLAEGNSEYQEYLKSLEPAVSPADE